MENRNDLKYAGFFTRLLVVIVDIIVISFVIKAIESVIPLNAFVILVIWWLYVSVMLIRWRTTIGGKLFGIEVLKSEDLEPLNFKWASVRFFVSIAPFFLYLYLRGMQHIMDIPPSPTMSQLPQLIFMLLPMIMFVTKKKQMIHDILVKSIVIDVNRTTQKDDTTGERIVPIGQKILRVIGTVLFLIVFGYVAIYTYVFYTLGKHSSNNYNASFHATYETNDYNDTKIIYYQKELEKYSKEFTEAEGMYDIFAADTKKDLALNCIQISLKEHNVSDWIQVGSNFRKNARNKYANTEEKIRKAKKNSNYMSKHFYTFDLNIVNHIEDDVTGLWSDKNDSICEKQLSSNELYEIFIPKYILKFGDQNIHSQFGSKPQQREVDWYELLKEKRNDVFKKISGVKEKRLKEDKKHHNEWIAQWEAEKQKKERHKLEKKLKRELLRKSRKEEKIVNQRKKVYISDIKRGVPPIFAAIQNHLYETLFELLNDGADIEMKYKGVSPLMFAIYQADDRLVKILLKYGANPNFLNGLYSPLSEACVTNRVPTVKLLLKYGADVNYQYKKSETALTVAAKGCKNFQLVKLLLENGADPKLIDRFRKNTLTGLKRYCNDDKLYKKMKDLIKGDMQ